MKKAKWKKSKTKKSETDKIISKGGTAATLGKRVLRAETAPLAALAIIMYITGNA